jgi:hypothetical protein
MVGIVENVADCVGGSGPCPWVGKEGRWRERFGDFFFFNFSRKEISLLERLMKYNHNQNERNPKPHLQPPST